MEYVEGPATATLCTAKSDGIAPLHQMFKKYSDFFYEDLFRNLVQRDTRLYNVAQSALFSLSVPCACRAHVSFNSCRAFSFVRVRFVKVSCG